MTDSFSFDFFTVQKRLIDLARMPSAAKQSTNKLHFKQWIRALNREAVINLVSGDANPRLQMVAC